MSPPEKEKDSSTPMLRASIQIPNYDAFDIQIPLIQSDGTKNLYTAVGKMKDGVTEYFAGVIQGQQAELEENDEEDGTDADEQEQELTVGQIKKQKVDTV
mmetsp:Transcript_9443/g.18776  ORF Transcript_9443/g.18776 Transcript_9443/m.18776 type:complete len:100 (+) Transcript_9443:17-316(+)